MHPPLLRTHPKPCGVDMEKLQMKFRCAPIAHGVCNVQVKRVRGLHSTTLGADRKKRYNHRGRSLIGEVVEEETLSKMCEWGLKMKMAPSTSTIPEDETLESEDAELTPAGWDSILVYRVAQTSRVMVLLLGMVFWVDQDR